MGTVHLPEKIEWFKLPKMTDPNTVRVFTKYSVCIQPRSQLRLVIKRTISHLQVTIWQQKTEVWPRLSSVERSLLDMPASNKTSEQAFSHAS